MASHLDYPNGRVIALCNRNEIWNNISAEDYIDPYGNYEPDTETARIVRALKTRGYKLKTIALALDLNPRTVENWLNVDQTPKEPVMVKLRELLKKETA